MKSKTTEAWEQFETALNLHAPHYLGALPAGASPERVAKIEAATGMELPADVKDFFLRHEGELQVQDPKRAKRNSANFCRRCFICIIPYSPSTEGGATESSRNGSSNKSCAERAGGVRARTYVGPVREVVRYAKWLPIATDIDGNGLYVDLDPADGGEVGQIIRMFYHARNSSIRVLAPSIAVFLNGRASEFLQEKDRPGGRRSGFRKWQRRGRR